MVLSLALLALLCFQISLVASFIHSSRSLKWQPSSRFMKMAEEFNWKNTKKATEEKMNKCIESIQQQFNTVRAGGANPALLDRVVVDYYGAKTPLSQVARITASSAQQLSIDPFEKIMLKEIELAISKADLNLTPTNDGTVVRINLPPLTEDRRKDLVKQAKSIGEEGKVAIRNVRRDFVEKVKAAEKDKSISKDDSKGFQDDLQKVTDNFVKKLDEMIKNKEKDLLKV